jgi:hypothetical protein
MSIFSWFFHTTFIFKELTEQIVYPKCNRMHHFASFWKKHFRGGGANPSLPLLVSRGLACMHYVITVCQWLAAGLWFSQGTPVSSTNKADRHDTTEILLKVTITLTLFHVHFNSFYPNWFLVYNYRPLNWSNYLLTKNWVLKTTHYSRLSFFYQTCIVIQCLLATCILFR